ncbi:MAG: 3-deoxy-D-manno-octulosonic acid transferase [Caldiserica bacterium]|nr:3-deoxy-D-manno-octulosonic acid transferase [Caldisericota bacterium]
MIFLYNFILLFSLPFVFFYLLKKGGAKERLGFILPGKQRGIWIHAVSVGEVKAAEPIIKLLRQNLPETPIFLSTVTSTGREVAKKSLEKWVDYLFYFPLDFPFSIIKVISSLKPRLIILMETELWPNLLYFSHHFSVPIILANGRLSPASFRNYSRFSFFLKPFLSYFSSLLVQTERDKKGFLKLGFPDHLLKVVGNTKFDHYSLPSPSGKDSLPTPSPPDAYPVICAGSTHPPEEKLILRIFQRVKAEYPAAKLILAPRHPERVKEVEKLIPDSLSYILRTEISSPEWSETILILNTVGELQNFYSLSDVAIMGGTFVPVGGHNPLEPLSHRVPVIFGPHVFNFAEIFSLIEGKGGIKVKNEKELERVLLSWLKKRMDLEKEGEKGYNLIAENRGASQRIWEEVSRRV